MHKIDMPAGAKEIIEELNKHGYEAYIVGGCVRDCLIGRSPNDWDITTNAKPDEVKAIFRRTVDTGLEHGTVTIMIGNDGYEVTTYRVDGEYEDHRRPNSVEFTANLKEDLRRRDFTVNAMAYNDEEGVIDIFGGIDDLEKGVIKCVGNADDRFDEDALRILRAVRFAAQLSIDDGNGNRRPFVIEEKTREAIIHHAPELAYVSAERIQVELTKLITSDYPEKLTDAYELGITKIILPEFDLMMQTEQNNKHHNCNVGMHTIAVMQNVPADKVLRYSALLHDSGKPEVKTTDENGVDHFCGHQEKSEIIAQQVLRRLKLDNETIKLVKKLIRYHDFGIWGDVSYKSLRRFLAQLGSEYFDQFIKIRFADIMGQSDYQREEKLERIKWIQEAYDVIIAQNHCLRREDLQINGRDLIELGVKPGREMGELLDWILSEVLENPELNDKEKLTFIIKKKINN